MNVDGKRSVNSILSSFCSDDGEAVVGRHVSSIGRLTDNRAEVVLDNDSNRFTVSKISGCLVFEIPTFYLITLFNCRFRPETIPLTLNFQISSTPPIRVPYCQILHSVIRPAIFVSLDLGVAVRQPSSISLQQCSTMTQKQFLCTRFGLIFLSFLQLLVFFPPTFRI